MADISKLGQIKLELSAWLDIAGVGEVKFKMQDFDFERSSIRL